MEIHLPDGTILNAPEGADPSVVAKNYIRNRDGGVSQSQPTAQPDMSMMDLLKATVKGGTRLGLLGVKGLNDSVVRTLLLPADAVSEGLNKWGPFTPSEPLGQQYQEWSDKQIAPGTNPVEKAADIAGGFVGGAKMPMPGGAAAAPAGQVADSFAGARNAGYAVTPSSVHPNIVTRTLESVVGPKELAAEASARNAGKMSENLTQQFGLPAGTEITHAAMDAVRADAGKAYDAISTLGPQYAALVQQIKSLRNTASKLYRQNASTYNADVEKQANETWQKAQDADNVLAGALKQQGGGDLVDNYLAARKTIAQTHDMDKAIIDSRAEVKPQTFVTAFAKEKPQSGAIYDIGRSAQAFGPSFNTAAGPGALSFVDKTLLGSGLGLQVLGHRPGLAAATLGAALGRHGLRKALLSGPVQDMMLMSPEQQKAALAASLLRGTTAADSQE